MRADGRNRDELRPVKMTVGFMGHADGSVLIECGRTRVICTATLEDRVPPFKKDSGEGWLTAEYAMLPASTNTRKQRETLRPDGRSVEIRRLIGRALRAAVDFKALGERTVTIDCDVIEADGGTRTASITGGFIAFALAAKKYMDAGILESNPVKSPVAAISVGIIDDGPALDLCYTEDSTAIVDMNLVMAGGKFIEVQGTGEGGSFSREELDTLLSLGEKGIRDLYAMQKEALGDAAEALGL